MKLSANGAKNRTSTPSQTVNILNIDIHNTTSYKLLAELNQGLVVTPNVDHLMKLQKDKDFFEIYRTAEYVLCDSRILKWASKLLGNPIQEVITGSDFFPRYCQYNSLHNSKIKIFIIGGSTPEIAKLAADNINHVCARNIICGYYSPPYGFENEEEEILKIINLVNKSNASVLAVGIGAPKQEKLIKAIQPFLQHVQLYFAIGATIDFQSGKIKRAPRWMNRVGLEWLYRMVLEPKRMIKRYLIDDLPFLYLLVKQKLGIYKNPFDL